MYKRQYLGDTSVEENHVEAIKDFVLNHRSNMDEDESSNQNSSDNNPQGEEQEENEQNNNSGKQLFEAVIPDMELKKTTNKNTRIAKKGTVVKSEQGVYTNTIVNQNKSKVDVKKTVSSYMATDSFELKHKQQVHKSQKHIIFLLDASGSMLKDKVIAYAKGVVQKMVDQEKVHKPLFSLVSITNNTSQLIASREYNICLLYTSPSPRD